MTRVSSSPASASMTSVSVTSAWLPRLAKSEKPVPCSRDQSRIAVQSAPECEKNPSGPGRGMPGANVTFRRAEGRIHPRQFGPRTRRGCPRSQSRIRASRSRPSGPASRKPAEMTTAAGTPFATQSSRTGSTEGAGTATTARSTSPGTARIEATAASPWTALRRRLTGTMVPGKPPALRLASTLPPTLEGSSDAPTTATDLGAKNGPSDGRTVTPPSRAPAAAPPARGMARAGSRDRRRCRAAAD